MAIDFPNSPTLNQTYTVGNVTWKYDGAKWVIESTTQSITANLSDATPLANGTAAAGTGTLASREDHIHPEGSVSLPDSPTFSGNVTASHFVATDDTSVSDNKGAFSVGTLSYSDTNILASLSSSAPNTYNQLIIQNTSNTATASADIVVSNNRSASSTYYGNFGMNSQSWAGSGAFNSPDNVYLTSTSADLGIGTTTANAIRFAVNGSTTDAMTIGSNGDTTMGGSLYAMAGTAAKPPIDLQTGVLLTTPLQGAIEFDGNCSFITADTTNGAGRQHIMAAQYGKLATGASVASGGAFFTNTVRPALLAGYAYKIEYALKFQKNTAGTLTFSFANSAATTLNLLANVHIATAAGASFGPNLGISADTAASTTSTASASMGNNTEYIAFINGWVIPTANTRLQLNVTCSAGTITSKIGSFFMIQCLSGQTTIGNIA